MGESLNRGTGLLLIDVRDSNPNGNPDRDSDPRRREDRRGLISSVSFKRKIRDLVAAKDGPLWQEFSEELGLSDAEFDILERRETERQYIKSLSSEQLLSQFWDVRVFGTTFLEEKKDGVDSFISTGVVQFGLGVSLDPIEIERMTTTKMLAVEEDKSRGMAPLAYRVVPYGLYAMPFFVNATAAAKTNCTKKDLDLLLRLIPHAYKETASYIRSQVDLRHAFYVEHNRARGTFSDFRIIEALTPERLDGANGPATGWEDYDSDSLAKSIERLNSDLVGKTSPVRDLMDEL